MTKTKSAGNLVGQSEFADEQSRIEVLLRQTKLRSFCRHWKVKELALFGSVLRKDFKADSDIDLLVTFASDASWGLTDISRMSQALSDVLGRKVDLVDSRTLKNPFRRRQIFEHKEVVYAS